MPALSEREQQLLKLAAEGFTDTAIAHRLGISEATVGTYWGRIRIKMGPYSRTELVGIAVRAEAEAALEELRAENARLSEQLQGSAQGDDSAFDIYGALLGDAPEACVVVNERAAITYLNKAADELFGYEPGELKGQHVSVLVPERLREVHVEHTREYMSDPSKRKMGEHMDTMARRKDGTEFPIAATLNMITTPQGVFVMSMLRDVSEDRMVAQIGSRGAAAS